MLLKSQLFSAPILYFCAILTKKQQQRYACNVTACNVTICMLLLLTLQQHLLQKCVPPGCTFFNTRQQLHILNIFFSSQSNRHRTIAASSFPYNGDTVVCRKCIPIVDGKNVDGRTVAHDGALRVRYVFPGAYLRNVPNYYGISSEAVPRRVLINGVSRATTDYLAVYNLARPTVLDVRESELDQRRHR